MARKKGLHLDATKCVQNVGTWTHFVQTNVSKHHFFRRKGVDLLKTHAIRLFAVVCNVPPLTLTGSELSMERLKQSLEHHLKAPCLFFL